ncbi:hypothetical protein ACFVR1_05190 [Psychrobacillus sp. NPDC058041]|uniref:hypothetical protein n=1 Tax=Psychrobacillus sp. NPDC058041 TaxID=3346310 RepID=UPI0036D7D8FB
MFQIGSIFILLMSFLLLGCKDNTMVSIQSIILEDEAKKMVLDAHYVQNEKTEILSVELKNNRYYIEWQIEGDCQRGIDSVNSDGEIKIIEAKIC